MRLRTLGLALIGVSLQGIRSEIAVAGDDCKGIFDGLLSPQVETRRETFKRLRATRKEQAAEVVRRLDEKATWDDQTYEGLADTLCDVAAAYRMDECAQTLARHVGFTLDPKSFPPMRVDASAYYPVARALARIGGRGVLDAIAPLLVKETGEARLRECMWIIRECLGRDGAKAWVSVVVTDWELRTALHQWLMEGVILPPAWKR